MSCPPQIEHKMENEIRRSLKEAPDNLKRFVDQIFPRLRRDLPDLDGAEISWINPPLVRPSRFSALTDEEAPLAVCIGKIAMDLPGTSRVIVCFFFFDSFRNRIYFQVCHDREFVVNCENVKLVTSIRESALSLQADNQRYRRYPLDPREEKCRTMAFEDYASILMQAPYRLEFFESKLMPKIKEEVKEVTWNQAPFMAWSLQDSFRPLHELFTVAGPVLVIKESEPTGHRKMQSYVYDPVENAIKLVLLCSKRVITVPLQKVRWMPFLRASLALEPFEPEQREPRPLSRKNPDRPPFKKNKH